MFVAPETSGWYWAPTDWLYELMVSRRPINNRCSLLKLGINPNDGRIHLNVCANCESAWSHDPKTILSLVSALKYALANRRNFAGIINLDKPEFNLLATSIPDPPGERPATPTFYIQAYALLLDRSDAITLLIENGRLFFHKGRHRVCGAYKFGGKHLPIYMDIILPSNARN